MITWIPPTPPSSSTACRNDDVGAAVGDGRAAVGVRVGLFVGFVVGGDVVGRAVGAGVGIKAWNRPARSAKDTAMLPSKMIAIANAIDE